MKIILHCFAQKLRGDKSDSINPKNYPYWKELIQLLLNDGHELIQIGVPGEEKLVNDFRTLSFQELKFLINSVDTWIAIDSFFQHLAWNEKKKGIVLFGQSNPKIFGHDENINLYANDKYFRNDQFGIWEASDYVKDAFVKPVDVVYYINQFNK